MYNVIASECVHVCLYTLEWFKQSASEMQCFNNWSPCSWRWSLAQNRWHHQHSAESKLQAEKWSQQNKNQWSGRIRHKSKKVKGRNALVLRREHFANISRYLSGRLSFFEAMQKVLYQPTKYSVGLWFVFRLTFLKRLLIRTACNWVCLFRLCYMQQEKECRTGFQPVVLVQFAERVICQDGVLMWW